MPGPSAFLLIMRLISLEHGSCRMPRLLTARKAAGLLEYIAKAVFERNCCSKLIQDTESSTEDDNNIYVIYSNNECP